LKAKTQNTHIPQLLINGDTKQLLARSRYLLYKSRQNGPTNKEESEVII
jgi:hypothetical protein